MIDTSQKPVGRGDFTVAIGTKRGFAFIDARDIIEFTFIEDIFSASMVGKLVFLDKVGGLELLPIVGHEPIYLSYGLDDDRTQIFMVYSINQISPIGQFEGYDLNQVEMYFVEPLFTTLTQRRYSLSFTNKKISDIIKHISDFMLLCTRPYVNFEETKEIIPNFYMPYWTPMEAIKWLSRRASSLESLAPGYLFYNNSRGLNFVTLEKLLKQTELEKGFDGTPQRYYFSTGADQSLNKILGFTISGIDYQSMTGIKGGHKLGYDFVTKSFVDQPYTYENMIKKFTLFGKKSFFWNISDTSARFDLEGDSDIAFLENMAYSDSFKRYIKEHEVLMTVVGHERRYAGMIVDIIWPSTAKEYITNKSFEGKYLVKSVTHQFSGRTMPFYKQLLVLLKTAYTDSIIKDLYSATKINLEVKTQKLGNVR
ncbi:MAG TPA: hypothetical protein P5293_00315 [Bacteroidales bacterium]|nr:hypothetical protein [Bacteroidales bacterium]